MYLCIFDAETAHMSYCNTLQHAATRCNTLQQGKIWSGQCLKLPLDSFLMSAALGCCLYIYIYDLCMYAVCICIYIVHIFMCVLLCTNMYTYFHICMHTDAYIYMTARGSFLLFTLKIYVMYREGRGRLVRFQWFCPIFFSTQRT